MDNNLIGFVVFIAGYVGGRLVNERALRNLDDADREKLLGGFSNYRVVSLIGLIIIVVFYFIARAAAPKNLGSYGPIFVGLLVSYLLLGSFVAYRKLHSMNMPDSYINKFLVSALVQYIGIFVFFWFQLSK